MSEEEKIQQEGTPAGTGDTGAEGGTPKSVPYERFQEVNSDYKSAKESLEAANNLISSLKENVEGHESRIADFQRESDEKDQELSFQKVAAEYPSIPQDIMDNMKINKSDETAMRAQLDTMSQHFNGEPQPEGQTVDSNKSKEVNLSTGDIDGMTSEELAKHLPHAGE